jgi:hypothetical protein
MNIRGIAVAIALSVCASGCEGPKGNLARSGRLVRKANQVLRDLLVLRAHRVLRVRRVLLALQVLPRTPFELCDSTVRPQRAEESATRTRYL